MDGWTEGREEIGVGARTPTDVGLRLSKGSIHFRFWRKMQWASGLRIGSRVDRARI